MRIERFLDQKTAYLLSLWLVLGKLWEVDRINEEGVPRSQLRNAMMRQKSVAQARTLDRCLLCSRSNVNEAGLCEGCYALLTAEELAIAERWLAGAMP